MGLYWSKCLLRLQEELPDQQYNTWIKPLQGVEQADMLDLLAPNRFVVDWVKDKYLNLINTILLEEGFEGTPRLKIGSLIKKSTATAGIGQSLQRNRNEVNLRTYKHGQINHEQSVQEKKISSVEIDHHDHQATQHEVEVETTLSGLNGSLSDLPVQQGPGARATRAAIKKPNSFFDESVAHAAKNKTGTFKTNLNESFTFESFVEGKSNQLGRAASLQVAENPGGAYNPLFIYGGVGLGKTHLMHSVGNFLVNSGRGRVVYLHSERFVADMVKALQTNAISEFKRFYRSVDALLIDDIQFFSGKERSQEEFFHTFNALLEGRQQMILTSDRYPKEISGVEERLKSRFGWGLTVAVEPPELETRVAIIKNKAMQTKMPISDETAFFIAQKICSNVRELEGALKRVIANAQFTGSQITLEFVKESLKDLLAIQDRQVSIDNIQKTVAEYFKIKTADLLSKRRNRSVARPRQVAMALAKDLTNHSLPEIGQAFGGRDHTTVLHGCRKIAELKISDKEVEQDFLYLTRILTT